MTGRIFAIKRFAIHDGDGIRTTVFFKGCPLRCAWCHNPEGISFAPQLAIYSHKCVNCGECLSCPRHAVAEVDGKFMTKREDCTSCGKCVDNCVFSARELFGRVVDADDLADELCADRSFFESSGGGVTLSGGECLAQPNFALALLKKLKDMGIHTAVDTCGLVSKDVFDAVIPYTDIFLYDIKAIDSDVHLRCTGQRNERILSNLEYLCQRGCRVEVRIPFIVGYNDGEIEKIGAFLTGKPVGKITVLQYHDLARSKYAAVSMEDIMPENKTDKQAVQDAVKKLKTFGLPVISGNED